MGIPAPCVCDNDRDEITVTLDGKEIRGWSYESEAERRVKMLAAREFCEGWFQSEEKAAELLRSALTQLAFWQATADRVPGAANSMPFIEPSSRVIDEIRAALQSRQPKKEQIL